MKEILTSLRVAVNTVLVCAIVYPAVVLGFAAVVSPEARQGSLIMKDGAAVGSYLVAQKFTQPGYFWPRPSAVDYDASAAGGSNLSPASPKITERARKILNRLQPGKRSPVPADLVLASGSGLDPHITRSAALFQLPRVANARSLSEDQVRQLVDRQSNLWPPAAFGGEPMVNVLELNLALDSVARISK